MPENVLSVESFMAMVAETNRSLEAHGPILGWINAPDTSLKQLTAAIFPSLSKTQLDEAFQYATAFKAQNPRFPATLDQVAAVRLYPMGKLENILKPEKQLGLNRYFPYVKLLMPVLDLLRGFLGANRSFAKVAEFRVAQLLGQGVLMPESLHILPPDQVLSALDAAVALALHDKCAAHRIYATLVCDLAALGRLVSESPDRLSGVIGALVDVGDLSAPDRLAGFVIGGQPLRDELALWEAWSSVATAVAAMLLDSGWASSAARVYTAILDRTGDVWESGDLAIRFAAECGCGKAFVRSCSFSAAMDCISMAEKLSIMAGAGTAQAGHRAEVEAVRLELEYVKCNYTAAWGHACIALQHGVETLPLEAAVEILCLASRVAVYQKEPEVALDLLEVARSVRFCVDDTFACWSDCGLTVPHPQMAGSRMRPHFAATLDETEAFVLLNNDQWCEATLLYRSALRRRKHERLGYTNLLLVLRQSPLSFSSDPT